MAGPRAHALLAIGLTGPCLDLSCDPWSDMGRMAAAEGAFNMTSTGPPPSILYYIHVNVVSNIPDLLITSVEPKRPLHFKHTGADTGHEANTCACNMPRWSFSPTTVDVRRGF